MTDNYTKIVKDNLNRLYSNLPIDLAENLPGRQEDNRFIFEAFGQECTITPGGIRLGDAPFNPVFGILISLYALGARPDPCVLEPLKAFKQFPDTAPYTSAFTTHTEQVLIPHVTQIKADVGNILAALKGTQAPQGIGGDFSLVVHPLPKIALCYIFYEADEDFPASVTCLFSSNARLFLSVDGLADVGEYCSKAILRLISHGKG